MIPVPSIFTYKYVSLVLASVEKLKNNQIQ